MSRVLYECLNTGRRLETEIPASHSSGWIVSAQGEGERCRAKGPHLRRQGSGNPRGGSADFTLSELG
jgi:hypothetical protein